LAKDESSKTLYIIVADIERRPIEKIVDDILAYSLRYKFVKFGIEGNHFQRVLVDLVKAKGEKVGLHIPLEAVINKDDKIARIQSLRPRFKSGNLQFSKKHRQLLEECRYFPKGRHEDGLDCLEIAVRISNDNGFSFGFVGGPSWPRDPDELGPLGRFGRRFHG
jgi:predicted phage terminase large subunit-like protein